MSKIEKALSRAGRHVVTPLRLAGPSSERAAAPAPGSSQMVSRSADTGSPADIEGRANASLTIARMRETNLRSADDLEGIRIIHPEMSDSPVVQAFRQIRTKIIQHTRGKNCIIMVTSAVGNGGGTFVSLNLASAFAFDAGKTALVIDCNFQHPSLQNFLADNKAPGLVDYLENPDLDLATIIHSAGIERLRVIPSGARRELAAEYFTSLKMKRFLDSVYQRYHERYIFLDAPPMTESADTQILADLCDFVLVVVPYGRVTTAQMEVCTKAFAPGKLLGVIFNGEPRIPEMGWVGLLKAPFLVARERLNHWVGRLRQRKPSQIQPPAKRSSK